MPRPPVTKPAYWPKLGYGGGSWYWNAERRKVELLHKVDGKRYRERCDTTGECITARDARRKGSTGAQVAPGPAPSTLTVAALLNAWWRHEAGGKAPRTNDTRRAHIALVADRLEGLAADVTVAAVEDVFVALIADGYAKGTLTAVRSTLNQAFTHGVRRGEIATNPVAAMKMPGGGVNARGALWLDAVEFDRMRAHLTSHPSTINLVLLVDLLAGLRPGEALGLCWPNVDFDAGLLHVRSELQGSQGGRVWTLVHGLKTKGARRTVKLPAELAVVLRRERIAQAERRLAAGPQWRESELVFTTATGNHFLPANLRRACTAACKAAGTKRLAPNGMRHSNASWLLHHGVPTTAVARHLGHINTRMVEATYGHAMVDVVDTAALFDVVSGAQ